MELNPRTSRLKRTPPPGSVPGTFIMPEDALPPKVVVYSYDKNGVIEKNLGGIEELKSHFSEFKHLYHWVSIRGIGDKQFLEGLAEYFSIHRLVLGDIVNVYQRPKLEEHAKHLFIVSRMLYQNSAGEMFNEQVSVFLGENYVISIQERHDEMLNPVKERLIHGKGYIRSSKPDFLAYAIIDAILDLFFPLLEKFGDYLDELEDELLSDIPKRRFMSEIQESKRELIIIRRTIWQERDKITDLLRTNTPLITESTRLFIKDAYDHSIQVMDIVESFREVTSSLMDIYLSSVNNRMNQIMKVLAVISTLFIPLTFIVGIYGMNFQRTNPVTGEAMPLSMPELYSPYGYFSVMVVMALIVCVQLYIFYRKGWLGKT